MATTELEIKIKAFYRRVEAIDVAISYGPVAITPSSVRFPLNTTYDFFYEAGKLIARACLKFNPVLIQKLVPRLVTYGGVVITAGVGPISFNYVELYNDAIVQIGEGASTRWASRIEMLNRAIQLPAVEGNMGYRHKAKAPFYRWDVLADGTVKVYPSTNVSGLQIAYQKQTTREVLANDSTVDFWDASVSDIHIEAAVMYAKLNMGEIQDANFISQYVDKELQKLVQQPVKQENPNVEIAK